MSEKIQDKTGVLAGIARDFRALMGCSKDLWIVYAVKFIESVAYFAVLGVLILYLHDDLHFSDETSGGIFGTWGTLVSLMTFISGFVADAMGLRKALLVAAGTLVVGRGLLLTSEVPALPLLGLVISVWGVASMKPVMTAAVKVYAPAELRAFAYNIFYVVMNLGAFVAGHVVSFLRRSLLGRVIRPSEMLSGVMPADSAAQEGLTQSLVQKFPAPEGAKSVTDGAIAFGKRVTGGRDQAFWTDADLTSIREAAAQWAPGSAMPDVPFGISGYELIFLVSAVLSVVSLLLLTRMTADNKRVIESSSTGLSAQLAGFRHLMGEAGKIGKGLLGEPTFRAYMLFISVLVLVRAIFVHAHSTWPTYMIREFGADVPQAALWSLNPLLIIFLTPVIGSLTSRFSSWSVIMWGSFITAGSVLFMVVAEPSAAIAQATLSPVFGTFLDYRLAGPVAFVFVLSIGEALWSPRLYDYVATMAPEGREASYMGLTQLPMFAAKPVVGLMSGWLLANYCPETGARTTEIMWTIVFATTLIGPLIALGFASYIRAAEFAKAAEDEAASLEAA
ncbi:MAG: MFS transporter [Myxococcales bacterium]|nr:MFS transporter [Myxococcales bacterium]